MIRIAINRSAPTDSDAGVGHLDILKTVAANLPRFPDGRIDYSSARVALVLNCVVRFERRILLLQRSDVVSHHVGKWSCVTGFIDRFLPINVLASTELSEELSLEVRDNVALRCAEPFVSFDSEAEKTWIVYPVLASFDVLPRIVLNSENTDHRWVYPWDVDRLEIIPGQRRALADALALDFANLK
jgi:hypothetical protein